MSEIISKLKKQFEDKWNTGKLDSRIMCDDGNYRILNDPGKIWKFFEKALLARPEVTGETSDGYHTFNELYEHRAILYIRLCRLLVFEWGFDVWRSKLHSDGSSYEGWFIMGIFSKKGDQISYHLPIDKWEMTRFAKTLDQAPEFDGHTPSDVLKRLAELW